MEVGQTVSEPRPKMQQRGCRRVRHPRVAVGSAGRDALEQGQHRAHLRNRVQRGDEVHLRGAGIAEARPHARVDERANQRLRAVHRWCLGGSVVA